MAMGIGLPHGVSLMASAYGWSSDSICVQPSHGARAINFRALKRPLDIGLRPLDTPSGHFTLSRLRTMQGLDASVTIS